MDTWARRNPERHRESVRRWKRNNPEKIRAWYARDRGKIAVRRRQRRLERGEEFLAKQRLRQRRWVAANREKYRKLQRDWASKQHPDKRRAKNYERFYGLSLDEVRALMDAQRSSCLICGTHIVERTRRKNSTKSALALDHSHTEQRVRGLLCAACNLGLGQFEDNAETLEFAREYVAGELPNIWA